MSFDTVNFEEEDLDYILHKNKKEFEQLSTKTILFTGAGGFLGYYFIKSILSWNKKNPKKTIAIFALDLFKSGIPEWFNQEDVKYLKGDITTFTLPADLNFDYIIHAASIASPVVYRQYPVETLKANVLGLYNILDHIVKKQKKIEGLLFFSSSEVYGDPTPENIPTPETYRGNVSTIGPRACYDESKRFGETLCINYARVYKLPIKIARPFNNYGPGLKITDGRVIPDFANNILQGKDIILLSEGSATRTFCYITDALSGYLKILVKGETGESYNIGVEKPEISIQDLAEKMHQIASQHFGYKGKVVKKTSSDKDYLTDNPNRRCPDVTKAINDLGYNPQVSLEEGLTNTLLWYKANHL